MPALLFLTYDVLDEASLMEYREAATPTLIGPGKGRVVTSTPETLHLAEAGSRGTHTVVLEFADVDHALRCYHSAEYQAVLAQRLAATTPRTAMIVPVTGDGAAAAS